MNTKLNSRLRESCIPTRTSMRIQFSWAGTVARLKREHKSLQGYYCITKQNIWEFLNVEQYNKLNDKSRFEHAFYVEQIAK